MDPSSVQRSAFSIQRFPLGLLLAALLPFVLALAVAICCYVAAGVTLALFFGPMLLLAFLAPPLAMAEETAARRGVVCTAISIGVVLVWGFTANLSIFEFTRCSLVLAAYVFALAGSAALLKHVGMGNVFAAALTVLIGFAWLTWPIWLVPSLTGPNAQVIVQRLTIGHPLMALNGVISKRFEFWDRFPMTHKELTSLNEDIFQSLPKTVAWMVALHCVVGVGGIVLTEILRRRRH